MLDPHLVERVARDLLTKPGLIEKDWHVTRAIGVLAACADTDRTANRLADYQGATPEVAAFACVDPVETAADKLSALAWRVLARQRGSDKDDPTIIRHLHDLACLWDSASASADFVPLVRKATAGDEGRGGEAAASSDPAPLFAAMLERLSADRLWMIEYESYVDGVSFAAPADRIGFDAALAAVKMLVGLIEPNE